MHYLIQHNGSPSSAEALRHCCYIQRFSNPTQLSSTFISNMNIQKGESALDTFLDRKLKFFPHEQWVRASVLDKVSPRSQDNYPLNLLKQPALKFHQSDFRTF